MNKQMVFIFVFLFALQSMSVPYVLPPAQAETIVDGDFDGQTDYEKIIIDCGKACYCLEADFKSSDQNRVDRVMTRIDEANESGVDIATLCDGQLEAGTAADCVICETETITTAGVSGGKINVRGGGGGKKRGGIGGWFANNWQGVALTAALGIGGALLWKKFSDRKKKKNDEDCVYWPPSGDFLAGRLQPVPGYDYARDIKDFYGDSGGRGGSGWGSWRGGGGSGRGSWSNNQGRSNIGGPWGNGVWRGAGNAPGILPYPSVYNGSATRERDYFL